MTHAVLGELAQVLGYSNQAGIRQMRASSVAMADAHLRLASETTERCTRRTPVRLFAAR